MISSNNDFYKELKSFSF